MSAITFTVPGRPIGWRRARTKAGRHFTDAEVSAYQSKVGALAMAALRRAGLPPFDGPVSVDVVAVYPRPKARPQWKHGAPGIEDWRTGQRLAMAGNGEPDADNAAKCILDALQPKPSKGAFRVRALVYADDCQVVRCSCAQWMAADGEAPHVEVTVRAVAWVGACCVEGLGGEVR